MSSVGEPYVLSSLSIAPGCSAILLNFEDGDAEMTFGVDELVTTGSPVWQTFLFLLPVLISVEPFPFSFLAFRRHTYRNRENININKIFECNRLK